MFQQNVWPKCQHNQGENENFSIGRPKWDYRFKHINKNIRQELSQSNIQLGKTNARKKLITRIKNDRIVCLVVPCYYYYHECGSFILWCKYWSICRACSKKSNWQLLYVLFLRFRNGLTNMYLSSTISHFRLIVVNLQIWKFFLPMILKADVFAFSL